MKYILTVLLCLCLLSSCCACTPAQSTETSGATVPTDSVPQSTPVPTIETEPPVPPSLYQIPMTALSVPIINEESHSKDGALIFTYTYQQFTLIHPDPYVAQAVTLDFLNRIDFNNSLAKDIYESAQSNYNAQSNWTPYSYSELYAPVRLDQHILSLYGTKVLTGNNNVAANLSVNYDLLTGKALEEISEILVADYSAEAICQLIYDALSDYATSGVLFADYAYIISDMFNTNTPVENWYFSDSGLCFYFSPYDITPHSAGTIVAEIPYASLNGLIKDQYFPAEQPDLSGNSFLRPFDSSASFSQIAEVIIDRNAEQYLLYTDGTLFNLKLDIGDSATNGSAINHSATVLAAASLNQGDAIMIQCTADTLSQLNLTYCSGGSTPKRALISLLPQS